MDAHSKTIPHLVLLTRMAPLMFDLPGLLGCASLLIGFSPQSRAACQPGLKYLQRIGPHGLPRRTAIEPVGHTPREGDQLSKVRPRFMAWQRDQTERH